MTAGVIKITNESVIVTIIVTRGMLKTLSSFNPKQSIAKKAINVMHIRLKRFAFDSAME